MTKQSEIEPVAWWNKSVGGFYLRYEHITPVSIKSHAIEPLYSQSDVKSLFEEIERLNSIIDKGK